MRGGPIARPRLRPRPFVVWVKFRLSSVGCDRRDVQASRPAALNRDLVLGSTMGGGFHLGAMIADDQTLRHTFVLANPWDRDVRILQASALSPCCSTIDPTATMIPRHSNLPVPVTFRPGFQAGRRRIDFLIATDAPDAERVTLTRTARPSRDRTRCGPRRGSGPRDLHRHGSSPATDRSPHRRPSPPRSEANR